MLELPGSKSIAQRAMLFASFCGRICEIRNVPKCDDTERLISALRAVGINVRQKNGVVKIAGGVWKKPKNKLDFGDNATGLRLFIAICAAKNIPAIFTGSEQLFKRPHSELIEALNAAGAKISQNENQISIHPNIQSFSDINFISEKSSQFASAIYLFAQLAGIKANVSTKVSAPYFFMTKELLQKFEKGITEFQVEPDISSLAPFIALSMITGKELKIKDLKMCSKQADMEVIKKCRILGAQIHETKEYLIFKPPNNLKKWGEINIKDFPDGALSLMIIAPFLKWRTIFKGVASLKLKESNRIQALVNAFETLGIESKEKNDELQIFPKKIVDHAVKTISSSENDHRISMNIAILCEILPNTKFKQDKSINKSFPDFWKTLANQKSLVLIGSRGTGKTQIGKMLAKKMRLPFKDLDEELEKKYGAISKIANEEISWKEFRKLESKLLHELLGKKAMVLATGGGTAESEINRIEIQKCGKVIHLNGDPDIIEKWVKSRISQPKYQKSLRDDMKIRNEIYSKVADLEINTTPWDPENIVKKILHHK